MCAKVGHRGKHKIADLWEEEPYTDFDKSLVHGYTLSGHV